MGETGGRAGGADPADGAGDVDGDGPGGAPDPPPPGASLADMMVDMPGVWRRLLVAHVPDRFGRCRGCRSDGGGGERWPCSLHRIATEARRLHDRKLTEAIDSD